MERFARWPQTSLLLLIACAWMSYWPLVHFGTWSGLNLDGSLIYLIAAATALGSLGIIWRQRSLLLANRHWLLLLCLALYTSMSIIWSAHPVRAVVTAGFLWLMVVIATSVSLQYAAISKRSALVSRLLTVGLVVSGGWALWQIIGESIGAPPEFTLLTEAYRSAVFGVARPTAFALEPQFFASLLLIPFGWLVYRQLNFSSWRTQLGLVATTTLLVLTLSRGGLLAAAVVFVVLVASHYRHWRRALLSCLLLLAGGICALLIMAGAATINQRDAISGAQTVARSLNHLSLGMIDIPTPPKQQTPVQRSAQSRPAVPSSRGYVASSTTSRLNMSHAAIAIWKEQTTTMLFGVGVGGFGAALHARDNAQPIGAITNNYFSELLVELGLIGALLFASFMTMTLIGLVRNRQWLVFALLAGALVQWNFFSGNANVIHLWLLIGAAIILASTPRTLHHPHHATIK